MAIAAARLRWCWRARNYRSSNKVDLSNGNMTSGVAVGKPGKIPHWCDKPCRIVSMGSPVRLQPGLGCHHGIEGDY